MTFSGRLYKAISLGDLTDLLDIKVLIFIFDVSPGSICSGVVTLFLLFRIDGLIIFIVNEILLIIILGYLSINIYFYNYNNQQSLNEMSQEEVLKQIQAMKKNIHVSSTELENFLQYIDQIVFKKKAFSFCGPPAVTSSPQFTRAFSTLKSYEKAEFYLSCLKIINEINKKKQQKQEVYCEQQRYQALFRDYKISHEWRLTFIILNYEKATLFLGFTGELLNLKHYLFRISKCKERSAFALQANHPNIQPLTLRLSANSEIGLQEIKYNVKKIMLLALRQSIFQMMNMSRQIRQQFAKKGTLNRESMSQQLTVNSVNQHKKSIKESFKESFKESLKESFKESFKEGATKIDFNMEQYQRISIDLINQDMIKQLDNFKDYEKIKNGVFFSHSKAIVKKIFTFEQKQITVERLANELFDYQNFKKWKASLFIIALLADITNQNTKIFHQVDMYKDSSQCDFVYLRHKFIRGDIIYFIDKSISTIEQNPRESSNNRGKIEYCLWRIKKTKLKTIEVTVQCQMNHIPCLDIYEIISEQIGEFDNIGKSKKIAKKQKQTTIKSNYDFASSIPAISQVSNLEFSQFTNGQGQRQLSVPQSSFYSISSKGETENRKKEKTEDQIWEWETARSQQLPDKYHYQVMPIQSPKLFQQFKGQHFFNPEESIINQKGQFIFVNAKKIQAQSNVLKNILKRLGVNLFQGKSLLNVSLPIQIFGTDTNIQRLSRAMAYGPHFLQNKINATPLERMKGVLSFSLGTILLYLEMTKPFNPVLGETYQGFIDGCPIYGEQISHHPPISSILFVGRGYFVSANLQAKVQFGLNSISGINEGQYKIAFHQTDTTKNVITFTSPPGSLAGIIYGERKLSLIKKTYFFDANNLILCEISWGKCKSQNKDSKYHDYLSGKIVRLKKLQLNFEKIKEKDIQEVLGYVSGRWTQQISFNNQVIFDVNSIKPFKVTNESVPLRSDSCFREDMILLGKQNMVLAQTMKEDIEQLQRKDRKLRKQYSK